MTFRTRFNLISLVLALATLTGCVTNPVTGRNELLLVGEDWELQVGKQQYLPLRQSQGGDYVVDPGVEKYVRSVGNKLAASSDRKLPYEFNVLNSSVPNAWALPGGKISINRGLLLELKSESELAAVLGHEIVHAAAKHGARGQSRGLLLQTAVMGAAIAGSRKGYGELAQVGAMVGAQIINSKYGRSAELESDLYGMRYMSKSGYDPQGAVDLQKTFVRLSEGRRQDFISGLFASHPPSQSRVTANIATASTLPKGGQVGRQRYQKAMARLRKTAPAYKNFEKAQKAAQKGNTAQAISLVNKAIKIEPREGHFYSLLGDIAQEKKDLRSAKRNYDKAIKLNNQFFYYYLQRANVLRASKNLSAAKADYARSLKLMPTADAQAALGNIAKASGNIEQAKRYFALAAQTQGVVGKKSLAALKSLEMGNDPQTYLLVRQGLTSKGTFAFELINQTSRPLTNIKIGIRTRGQAEQRKAVQDTLPAGKSQFIDTGKRMSQKQAKSIKVVVVDVQIAR